MNTLRTLIGIAVLAASSFAQETANHATMSQLSQSATEKLEKSTHALNALREEIANEKLPLATELTALEEKLAEMRREHERVTRLVDSGNLELPAIKAEIKAREDELSYIGNLLDEYARTFESKVNVSELQYCGAAIDAAKQAAENVELSAAEKFTRQLAFAKVSLQRLFDAVGGMRFPGVGVDVQGMVTEGQFAIIGPVALFHATSGDVAGLVIPQSGSDKPLIRPLDGVLQTGLVSLLQDGNGFLPLDPSRGGALKALVQKTNLLHVFEKGGPIMWPLLFASVLALATVLERILFLILERTRRDPKALDQFFTAVGKGDIDGAIQIGKGSKFYVVRALSYALGHREQSLPSAVLYAQAQELKRYRRGIPILDTVITLAPLLGLLGTVVGMMGSFSLIGGDLSAPGAITGGIAEALIATAFGLGIAITCLLPFNFLNTKMEDARHEIESAGTQLELIVQPSLGGGSSGRSAGAGGHDRGEPSDASARELAERRERERELRRKREALQRSMDELDDELNEPEPRPATPASSERPGPHAVRRGQTVKD